VQGHLFRTHKGQSEQQGQWDAVQTREQAHKAKLYTALAGSFSIALGGERSASVERSGEWTNLSLGGVAVEAGLGCAVASALAVVGVDGEVEIHDFSLEDKVGGSGHEKGRGRQLRNDEERIGLSRCDLASR